MTATAGHNITPTADAEDLLDVFSRVPDALDQATVGRAITLAKQMKLAADELDQARKDDGAELRERLADLERPYRQAHERLEEARQEMLERLATFLKAAGRRSVKNELGLQAYAKRRIDWEVDDAAKVPTNLCKFVPNPDAIGPLISTGVDVPGIRRVEKSQTIVV